MQRLHSTEISKLAAKHEKAVVEAVKKTSNTSAAEMKVKMEALESVHAAALAGAQAASEEQLRENTRKALDETAKQIVELQREHAEERRQLEAASEAAVTSAERRVLADANRRYDEQLQIIEAGHRSQLQTLHASHVADVERLSHEHELALIDYTKRQQSVLSAHMQERERLYTDLAAQHQRARIIMVWHHGWFSTT